MIKYYITLYGVKIPVRSITGNLEINTDHTRVGDITCVPTEGPLAGQIIKVREVTQVTEFDPSDVGDALSFYKLTASQMVPLIKDQVRELLFNKFETTLCKEDNWECFKTLMRRYG
jgi:hypothetical protein